MNCSIVSINFCPVKSLSFQSLKSCDIKKDIGIPNDRVFAFSRGINPGEHIVNIHLYRDDNMAFEPFLAKIVVTIVDPETKIRNQILESDVLVSELGEEITVFRFKLDDKGTLDQSSINNNYIQLRSGQK